VIWVSCLRKTLASDILLTQKLGLLKKTPAQQIIAIFDIASELSMPFCRSTIQQIFETDSSTTEQSSDGLSSALLDAIKLAMETDQTSGVELLATLDNALTDKVCVGSCPTRAELTRVDSSAC
jgi:hypothetical protein